MASVLPRPASRQADHYLMLTMCALILTVVFVGFARSYFFLPFTHGKLPSMLVHIHGALFTAWVLLLAVQVSLVTAGNVKLHRKLGVLGGVIAAGMVVAGIATLFAAVQRHFASERETAIILPFDAMAIVVFATLVTLGFVYRRDGAAHKRLMLLATISIMAPALSRWPTSIVPASTLGFFLTLDVFLFLLIAFDLWSRRRIHRVTLWGSAAIIGVQLLLLPLAKSQAIHNLIAWIERS